MQSEVLKHFSYAYEHPKVLEAIFGRNDLLFEPARLIGYEQCHLTVMDLPDQISPNSPINRSPREIMAEFFGEDYPLLTIRPQAGKFVDGLIWYITKEEYAYMREWEMIDHGMADDITAQATNALGDMITVQTYGFEKNTYKISSVAEEGYRKPQKEPSQKKLDRILRVKAEFKERMKNS